MPRSFARSFQYFSVSCLAFCLAAVALAKDGRDFAGFYAVTNVHDLGDPQDSSIAADRTAKVELALTVQVQNNSDLGDLKEPVLALLGAGTHLELGRFTPIKLLPAGRDVIVSGQFTVTREEFKIWSLRGAGPRVVMIYQDPSGRTLRQTVQLSRRPMLPPPTAQ
jgi:hypothetical protein